MATQAEVRELIAQIRRTGYKVTKSGTKHYKVLDAKGAVVTDEKGPLIISATPSDNRWREMTVKRLMAKGVFATDPYKSTTGKKGEAPAEDENGSTKRSREDELKERERARVTAEATARSEDHRARTKEVRSRIERLIVKLGGWNTGGTSGVKIADFTRTMHHWAKAEGDLWPKDSFGKDATFAAASQSIGLLRKADTTLGSRWLPLLEAFLDALEVGTGMPPDYNRVAGRYQVLARAEAPEQTAEEGETEPEPVVPPVARSLPQRRSSRVTVTHVEPEPEREYEPVGPAHREGYINAPTLALRVLFHMTRGQDDLRPDEKELIEMAAKIAEYELNGVTNEGRRMVK